MSVPHPSTTAAHVSRHAPSIFRAPQAVTRWRDTQQMLLSTREANSKAQAAKAVQEASMGYVSC